MLTLYELAGADPAVRFSPHCWKTRLALEHKGLAAERQPWRFVEKGAIAFAGTDKVPVLVDDGRAVVDSWAIALHLEAAYADRPSLFGAAAAQPVAHFVNAWADTALMPALSRLIITDVYAAIDAGDRDYFRRSREQRFGMALEQVTADRDSAVAGFRAVLAPLRRVLADRPFVGGAAPLYADHCAFGPLMWARCVSSFALLAADDPVAAWAERMLDAYDGLARSAPRAVSAA